MSNSFIKSAGGEVDYGLMGRRTLSLNGDVTLTPSVDYVYQFLNANGANRNITLSTTGVADGNRFFIKNTGGNYLQVNAVQTVRLGFGQTAAFEYP